MSARRTNSLRQVAVRRGQRGLSIIELMISIAIGLFLLAGLVSLLVSNVVNRSELDKTAQQIENGRYAISLLSQDIEAAGFNGAAARSTFTQVAPVPCPVTVGQPLLAVNIGQLKYIGNASSSGPSQVPYSVYAPTAADGLNCLDNPKTGTAALIITRLSTTTPVTAASVSTNTTIPYMQVSACSTDAQPITVGMGGSSFTLLQKDCSTPALVRTIIQRMYYVSTCNVCTGTNADTTPTLKVVEYANGALQVTPLVEGIEDLQFDYGMDYDIAAGGVTGSPSCYVTDPADLATLPAAAGYPSATSAPNAGPGGACATFPIAMKNWTNVVAVRIHLRARSAVATAGWTDMRSYDMGLLEGTVGPFNDGYKRHIYSTLARLNNVSGQRE
jgi:type IV pilus assembly protein PilW